MAHIDTGYTGAKRQSWRHDNPRDVLREIIAKHPRADKDQLFKAFLSTVSDNEGLLETIIEYWFTNNLNSLRQADASVSQQLTQQRREMIAAVKKQVKARIKIAATIMLLDLKMPNDKSLRDCTGKECEAFGGWLTRVASQMDSKAIVGKTFTEEQLRQLFEDDRNA